MTKETKTEPSGSLSISVKDTAKRRTLMSTVATGLALALGAMWAAEWLGHDAGVTIWFLGLFFWMVMGRLRVRIGEFS